MVKKLYAIIMSMMIIIQFIKIPYVEVKANNIFQLSGSAHVQTYGDKIGSFNGEKLVLGTTGQSKRLEEITLNLTNNTGYEGSIQYRVHRQTYGWTDWINAGQKAGTRGQGKRLEGIQIRLTGELAKHYSVKYRVHIQTYGWAQGWQYDGALAGTETESKRLECLEVKIVPKSEEMGVIYRVHRQTYGWENKYAQGGQVSGTIGESKRLEGIEIALTGNKYSGSINYRTHVQSYAWMNYVSDGMMSGTSGESKRLEAIQINLSGDITNYYNIYYRVHAQSYGWLGWAKNGEIAGTSGLSKRLEAIQIVLLPKNDNPNNSYLGIESVTSIAHIDKESGNIPNSTPASTPNPVPDEKNPVKSISMVFGLADTEGSINILNDNQIVDLKRSTKFIISTECVPSNATDKNITWTSSNSDVIEILKSENNSLTGIAKSYGKAVITAVASNGVKKGVTINVNSLEDGFRVDDMYDVGGMKFYLQAGKQKTGNTIVINENSVYSMLWVTDQNINYSDMSYKITGADYIEYDKSEELYGDRHPNTKQYFVGGLQDGIAIVEAGWDTGYYYKNRVSMSPRNKKGSFVLWAYYKGELIEKFNIIVDTVDSKLISDLEQVHEYEKKAGWTNDMSDEEKLHSLQQFICDNFYYSDMTCVGGAYYLLLAARYDLGLECYYNRNVNQNGVVNGFTRDYRSVAAVGGHVYMRCIVDGEWHDYHAQGFKKD